MPRIKPPRHQQDADLVDLPLVEDHTPPTEDIEIALALEEPGDRDIELVPAAPQVHAPAPAPAATSPGDDALVRAAEATRRAEELQRNLADRDRQIRERDEQLVTERTSREEAEYNSVLTAITAEQSALEKAEADYAAFASAGDWGNAAKAQTQMAKASARIDRLDEGKQAFESRRQDPPAPARQTAPTPPAPLDFEQKVTALGVPDSAKSWLRTHPEFVNDAAKNDELGSAHSYLVGRKKIEPFSQAYFDALDTEFGFKTPAAAATPEPDPAAQPPRRSIPMTAPVSRDVPSATGQRQPSTKITLTAEQRQIARTSFTAPDLTNEQKELMYARNLQKLQRDRADGSYPQSERN